MGRLREGHGLVGASSEESRVEVELFMGVFGDESLTDEEGVEGLSGFVCEQLIEIYFHFFIRE